MWSLAVPWWQLVARAVIIYAFLLVLLRMTGKRQVGQLAPFDLVLLLVISNTVQNAMNAGDNSVTAGLILAGTVVVLNMVVAVATYASKAIERVLEGHPQKIVHEGRADREVMRQQLITEHELLAALRQAGCASLEEVREAFFENNGSITVPLRRK